MATGIQQGPQRPTLRARNNGTLKRPFPATSYNWPFAEAAGVFYIVYHTAGWSSQVARWAHNPKVAGSNPAPATKISSSNQGVVEGRRLPDFLSSSLSSQQTYLAPTRQRVFFDVPHVMSVYRRVAEEPGNKDARTGKIGFDERLVSQLVGETPLDRVEAQELRQIMLRALQGLTRDELRIVELRHQHKKSPGQVASKLNLSREAMATIEQSALAKLKKPLAAYLGR